MALGHKESDTHSTVPREHDKYQGLLQRPAGNLWVWLGQPSKAPRWVLTRGDVVDAMHHLHGTIRAELLVWLSETL